MDFKTKKIKEGILGSIVGDALGVPYEFRTREMMCEKPCTDMIGHGTYDLPAGSFSDDSSMILCTLEMLKNDFDYYQLCEYFLKFQKEGFWTPFNECFDIGHQTNNAIYQYELHKTDKLPWEYGGNNIIENGNGSLMRIIPILYYIKDLEFSERLEIISKISSLTHGHYISKMACLIYIEYLLLLYKGQDKFEAYENIKTFFLKDEKYFTDFFKLLKINIYDLSEDEIFSGGYVIETLESSFYCFLTTDNYNDAVLKAVNLGQDCDTTACVTGGLAGLYYGIDENSEWVQKLQRKEDIIELINEIENKY